MAPGQPFSYSFMDDDFNRMYDSEQRTGKIFITFAMLAIFIACLGLYGLVTYAAEQRTREIGIRKVLGSMRSGLVWQFLTESVLTCFIAALLAVMLAALALPWFNHFSGKSISAMSLLTGWTLPVLAVTIVVVGDC